MNDATDWIDPELVAAGKLLQSRGLVAADRTQAPLSEVRAAVDRIGAFLGEGSVPLARERDLALPGPHGQVPCRLYLPDDAERPTLLVYAHGGGFMQGSLAWQRIGQGAGLSQTQMRCIWETYLERPDHQTDWRAAPILADLAGLPMAYLIVGSLDPLLDNSHRLASRLKEASVPCDLTV